MGDDITIGVTEIVNNIEVTAQPNDQIVDISVVDNTDEVTLNITPTVIEINVNKGSSYAKWGTILGTLSDQEDLQDALDLKADLVDGKVPSYQLPSYVDDVIEVANYAALPASGETGKIYITLDDNHIFRWTGSTYVEITDNTAVWGAITGTLSSQTDLQSALNLKANDNAVVHLTGNENISGTKTFGNTIYANGGTGEGEYAIEIDKSFEGEAIRVKNASSTTFTLGLNGAVTALRYVKSGGTSSQFLKADGSVDSTSYQTSLGYTPANDSAVVHIEGVETVNGIKTFSNSTKFDYGINLKQDTTTAYFPNYTTIDGYNNGYIVNNGDARAAIFYLANNVSRVYNFPDANGTFALTSDLSAYALDNSVVKLTGDQTVAGIKTFTSDVKSTAFRLTGGTSGTGLYYGHTNKVVLANYTVGGGIDFETNGGNINMILNGNGNLGIGVDPSAWDSLWKVLQLSYGSLYSSIYSNIMAHNLYVAGEDTKYISSNLASQYEQNSGSHYWYTAPSGTAGANMTLTPRMILDNSGNVGIGTTSPTSKLYVYTANGWDNTEPLASIINMDPNTAQGFALLVKGGAGSSSTKIFEVQNDTSGSVLAAMGNGNVGIGTTSPGVSLEVNGLIRSIPVYNNTTATAANLVVSAGGTFERSTSSLKYKKEVRDYDKGLETLLQIRPVYYKGKAESDGDKQFAGLIAEEIHELGLTEFVQYAEDETPDALAYAHMIALLVKAIQEQNVMLQELKSEIEILKNK